MEEENKQLLNDEKDKEEVKPKPQTEEEEVKSEAPKKASGGGDGGGGGGGWGFSTLSVFSDLQKAAEEISRNVRIHISPLSLSNV